MLLKLYTSICSLCEDTDVSLSESDTKPYIQFIKEELGNDLHWDNNSKNFRVCLLCTHSLDLLKEVVTGIENRTVKSCFCCKSSRNLFKQSDLPKNHKANVAAFASAFNLRGLNICLHCFYAINFWVKLKSFVKSSNQAESPRRNSLTISSPNKKNASKDKTDAGRNYNKDATFRLPRNLNKLPEIRQQIGTIKVLQSKMNRKIYRKFASDKKLVEQVPFVFLTPLSGKCAAVATIEISDDSSTDDSIIPSPKPTKKPARLLRKKIASAKSHKQQTVTSSESSDIDETSSASTPVRENRNKPVPVKTSPLKSKNSFTLIKKKMVSTNGTVKSKKAKSKKNLRRNRRLSAKVDNKASTSEESDDNSYSVTSSGSNTGIVIKRIARTKKSPASSKLASSPLRTIRIQTKKSSTSSNTSSDNTDLSPIASIPRSPVTLPPKKNRKRIMDLTAMEFEPMLAVHENKERRSTRITKSSNNKHPDEDIEEVIIDSSEDDAQENDSSVARKQSKGKARKVLSDGSGGDKDPLEIVSSEGDTDKESAGSPRKLAKHVKSSAEVKKATVTKGLKPGFKRLMHDEDSSEDLQETQPAKNGCEEQEDSEDANMAEIMSKYVNTAQIDTSVDISTKDIEDQSKSNSESTDKEPADSLNATQGTEEVNFNKSLVSPPTAHDQVNTMDLLATINEQTVKDTNDADINVEGQLNLQLTPEAEIIIETESTLLMTNEDDLFNAETQVIHYGDADEEVTKVSTQGSNYQDAVDVEQPKKVVDILQEISFNVEGDSQSENGNEVKDAIEEALISMDLNVEDASIITEDDSDVDKERQGKRKRTADESIESVLTFDSDETPRTKRVRFAAERKILNEDDSVCLEQFDSSDEHQGEKDKTTTEELEEEEKAEDAEADALCSLDI